MTLTFSDKLSKDLTNLLGDREGFDVIIKVGRGICEKSFAAHSAILRYRSLYFCEELSRATIINNKKVIVKPNISAELLQAILKYMYGGIINLDNTDKFIFDLMILAHELKFEELSKKLEIHIIENKIHWICTNLVSIYNSIFRFRAFGRLKNFCDDIVVKHPDFVFDIEDFVTLNKTALVSILKRYDLQMKEIKIWHKIIQWGIARHNTLYREPEEWTKEDFSTLKTTIQEFLPHIRYFQISNADFWKHVRPYRKILDKQLCDDLFQRIILPDEPITSVILPARLGLIESTVINSEHAAEISAWIDNKTRTYSTKDVPYSFQLILRGTRDGFKPRTFWDMCHGHTNTIVVLKVAGTDEILGGYNPLAWDKETNGTWIKTTSSFIFSLKNGNIQNSILSRVKVPKYAAYNGNCLNQIRLGPYFGQGELCMLAEECDLRGKSNYCTRPGIYEKRIRKTAKDFSIVDYEIFKIIK